MEFTFGIITDGNNDSFILKIIKSIRENKIDKYEIIIVGNSNISCNEDIKIINFDESIKSKWITKKKNLIAENAQYENIVLLHDYIYLDEDWYEGFKKYGDNFDICVNKIKNTNGRRFRDYTIFPALLASFDPYYQDYGLLPYDFINNEKSNRFLYVSGSYYIIKKSIALKYKLNEELTWGESEDLELINRLKIDNFIIKCNPYSTVHFLREKGQCDFEKEMSMEMALKLYDL